MNLAGMELLEKLAAELPTIQFVQSSDPEYAARRKLYNLAIETKPLAIAFPKSADEVASIVKFSCRTGVSIVVRCGGHDLFGRSMVDDGIVVDVRALDSVTVRKEAGQAVIGGGAMGATVCKVLSEHGCITPCPNVSTQVGIRKQYNLPESG